MDQLFMGLRCIGIFFMSAGKMRSFSPLSSKLKGLEEENNNNVYLG